MGAKRDRPRRVYINPESAFEPDLSWRISPFGDVDAEYIDSNDPVELARALKAHGFDAPPPKG